MTVKEIEEIRLKFNRVISYSQNIPEPQTEEIFKTWERNKKKFINVLGGLIYEYPERVSFELSEKEQHQRIMGFVDQVANNWGCDELSKFLEAQEAGFFKNITVEDFKTYNGKTIKKGTKLVKSFKYFVPEGRKLEDLQNEASRIIQENKIEGTLCISAHPLDYLSSSETTYNWRSCHSLDGDYRAGNISYMLDNCTLVCYLKGDKEEKLPHFPEDVLWNSKKWRMLLYFSDDNTMMFAGRQYPFESAFGRDLILNKVLEACGLIHRDRLIDWTEWTNLKYKDFKVGSCHFQTPPYIPVRGALVKLSDLIVDVEGSRHYNDLLYSNCYDAVYSMSYDPHHSYYPYPYPDENTRFYVGGKVPCLSCAAPTVLESGSGSMMCSTCTLEYGEDDSDLFAYCDCCGNRFYADDGYSLDNYDFICPECFERYTMKCECCGAIIYKDEMIFDDKHNGYFCPDCFYNKEEK